MTEESIYTIIIQKKRVKVSREVYYAYHKAREAERYQNRIIRQSELSLERFREEGVYVEFRANDSVPEMEEKMIRDEERHRLYQALDELSVDERMLIESLRKANWQPTSELPSRLLVGGRYVFCESSVKK